MKNNTCNRRDFVKGLGLGLVATSSLFPSRVLSAEEKTSKKPHIIFFFTDDHGWRESGVYGNSYIKTPNMDRLAKESMVFTHAYAGSPTCNPSRNVVTTGMLPYRNGGPTHPGSIYRHVRIMPSYMRELGYTASPLYGE